MIQINKDLQVTDELKAQLEELFKDAKVVIEPQENFIPKSRFDEVNAIAKDVTKYKDYDEVKAERDALKAEAEKYVDYEDIKAKAEKLDEYADYDDIKTKYEETTKTNKKLKLKTLGVDDAFLDYSLTQIGDEDFDVAAEAFITANPKFRAESFQQIDSSLTLGGGAKLDMSKLSSEAYVEARKTHDAEGNLLTKK